MVTGQGAGGTLKTFLSHLFLEARSDKNEDFVMLCSLILVASKHGSYRLNAT